MIGKKVIARTVSIMDLESMLMDFGFISGNETIEDAEVRGYSFSDADPKRLIVMVETDDYDATAN